MSMTPDQILQLPTFGKIPAETQFADLRKAFSGGQFMGDIMFRNQTCLITTVGYNRDALYSLEYSSYFSSFVSATRNLRVYAILMASASGSFKLVCQYTNGANTDPTTKRITNGSSSDFSARCGGAVFGWTVTQANITANSKFNIGINGNFGTGTAINLKCTVFGFPIEYGYTI